VLELQQSELCYDILEPSGPGSRFILSPLKGVAHIVRHGKVKQGEERREERIADVCLMLICFLDYKLWTVRHIVDFLTLQQHVSAKHSTGQRLDL
jgi:hypothetical protein